MWIFPIGHLTFVTIYVLLMFVNTEAPRTELPPPPDPAPDRSPANAPEGIGCFLILLRWIIGYGQQLASALRDGTIGGGFERVVWRYHTKDIAVILARIQRGLMLAAGLQDRLTKRATTGRDLTPAPVRYPEPRPPRDGNSQRRRAPRKTNIIDLPLDRLPTAEEIADELRRRPAGAVLVDICRDLGILPGDLPPELRQALETLVVRYGGSVSVLVFKEMAADLKRRLAVEMQRAKDIRTAVASAPAPACSTGPPPMAAAA